MKGSLPNSILSTVLNFQYETKADAVRNNVLIESIFDSKILPELDKAISKEIPQETLLEISKLEIDIGSINENEITTHLASRIKTALEHELQNMVSMEIDAIKTSNAGVILCWPFLTRFFEELLLLKEGDFKDTTARNRAVYLLQYLGHNDIGFPDEQLVLNKVIMGMSSKEALVPIKDISLEEKELAQSLLNGLIGNWKNLKSSTPEALQETFLQRDGILLIEEDKCVLKVAKKAVDVLLNAIPWNISLIKLPWMKKPLYVEWG